jgi:hypothetical protein
MQAAQRLIETDKSNKDENKIILSKFMMAHDFRQSNMKSKFFLQISGHQQSMASVPSRGLPQPPALLMVADFGKSGRQ